MKHSSCLSKSLPKTIIFYLALMVAILALPLIIIIAFYITNVHYWLARIESTSVKYIRLVLIEVTG